MQNSESGNDPQSNNASAHRVYVPPAASALETFYPGTRDGST